MRGRGAKQNPAPAAATGLLYWPRILFAAGAYPPLLLLLRDLAARGAAITPLSTGRLKLAAGRLSPAAWAEACAALEPHREDLIRVLRWAGRGYVSIRSRLLAGEVVHLTADRAWLSPAALAELATAGAILYAADELERLAGLGPEELRAVHGAKRAVGGEVVGDGDGG